MANKALHSLVPHLLQVKAKITEEKKKGTSLVVQWLRRRPSTAGAWIQSLVRELRSCMLRSVAKKKKKWLK